MGAEAAADAWRMFSRWIFLGLGNNCHEFLVTTLKITMSVDFLLWHIPIALARVVALRFDVSGDFLVVGWLYLDGSLCSSTDPSSPGGDGF